VVDIYDVQLFWRRIDWVVDIYDVQLFWRRIDWVVEIIFPPPSGFLSITDKK
jgi:hypothetical protein